MRVANDTGIETGRIEQGTKLQIFDLKQMADMEDDYKRRAQKALKTYRRWQKLYAGQSDMVARLYGTLEGQVLRRQAADNCRLYWIMRCDFRRAFKLYLQQNNCGQTKFLNQK